jgi:hypothetical protein
VPCKPVGFAFGVHQAGSLTAHIGTQNQVAARHINQVSLRPLYRSLRVLQVSKVSKKGNPELPSADAAQNSACCGCAPVALERSPWSCVRHRPRSLASICAAICMRGLKKLINR